MAEETQNPDAAKGETPDVVGENAPPSSNTEKTSSPANPDEKAAVSEMANREEVTNPAAGVAHTPDIAQENAPSTSEPVATPLPSANKPDDESTGPDKKPKGPNQDKAAGIEKASKGEPGAKPDRPKKEKAPALEDKPFTEFINQDYLPSLKKTFANIGIQDVDLKFEKQKLPVRGLEDVGECWQVLGRMHGGQRQFVIGFIKDDIQGQKVFSCADNGSKFSTLESFMIDERKVNLDLLLLYTVQRLNGQKWLVRN